MSRPKGHAFPRSPLLAVALIACALLAPGAARSREVAVSNPAFVRQIKRMQLEMLQSERWERDGDSAWEREAEQGRDIRETGLGPLCDDCPGAGLGQRRALRTPEDGFAGAGVRTTRRSLAAQGVLSYGRNVNVNDPGLDDPGYGDGQSEPSIAAWGTYVLAAWNDGRGLHNPPDPGFFGVIAYAYSTDGGQTFTEGGIVPSPVSGGVWTSDPVISVNEKTGDFYLSGLIDPLILIPDAPDEHGVGVARADFADGTLHWRTVKFVRRLAESAYLTTDIDKPWVVADSVSGNVYLSYTRFFGATDDSILFTRSTDRGVTWSPSALLSSAAASGLVQGSRPAVGPDGELYVTWKEIDPDTTHSGQDILRIRKSVDFGASFGPERTVARFFDNFGTGAPSFNREQGIGLPSIAVDRTRNSQRRGRVYVAWNETVNFYDSEPGTTPELFEVENNDSTVRAQDFTPGQTIIGSFGNGADFDWYRFDAVRGTSYVFWCDRFPTRYTLRIICSDGVTRLAFSGNRSQGFIVWTCPATGSYYMRMVIIEGALGAYRVRTSIDTPGGPAQRARDQRDVFVASSDDGSAWSTPVLVHPDEPIGYDDWLPEVAVGGPGSLYTLWYDWADSPPASCGGQSQAYMARSDDGGATWASLGPVSDQFGDWTNSHSDIVPNQGDYLALFANQTAIYPCWADPRIGTPDVYTSPITLDALQVYIESVAVDTGHVAITWRARGTAPPTATVYRAPTGQAYVTLGSAPFDGAGRTTFDDNDVVPGTQYRYALGVDEGGSQQIVGERTVQVPGRTPPVLGFLGVTPNPSPGSLRLGFFLPDARPGEVALYDVFGRLIRRQPIQGSGAHDLDLGQGLRLESGLYFILLSHGGRQITRRVSIVR